MTSHNVTIQSAHPDLILTGGVIHTMAATRADALAALLASRAEAVSGRAGTLSSGSKPWWPVVSALAIRDGKVIAAGSDADIQSLAGPGTRRIPLFGATVLPGFNDSHMHLWKEGMLLRQVNARPAAAPPSNALIAAYRERAQATPPGVWIEGRGYDENRLSERRHPTRDELDLASRHHPLVLGRTCGHILVANSLALQLAGIDATTPDPMGGEIERDAHGEPTGVLRETAMALVRTVQPPPSEETLSDAIVDAGRRCLSLGITSVGDPGVDERLVKVYRQLDEARLLPMRCDVMAMTISPTGERSEPPVPWRGSRAKVDTCKLFSDGGLSGGTAALSIPYPGRHDCGFPRFPAAQLQTEIARVYDSGSSVAVHSIGDFAIDMVLDAFEHCLAGGVPQLRPESSTQCPPQRLRIEHFGLPSPEQLKRALALNVRVATQPVFLSDLGDSILRYLPESLVPQCYPFRAMLEAGLTVGFSSDGPVVTSINPWEGLTAAVHRTSRSGRAIAPEQAIDMAQALWCYTAGSAQVAGTESHLGQLRPGFEADLIVLSADPLTVSLEKALDIRVTLAMVSGQVAFEA